MGLLVTDNDVATQADPQSELFNLDFLILDAALQGNDLVVSGCTVTTHGSDLTPNVAAGVVVSNKVYKTVTGATVTIGAANGSNPRIDVIVIDSAGAKQVRAGTAAAHPKPPALTANDVALAFVLVRTSSTSILAGDITDKRCIVGHFYSRFKFSASRSTNQTLGASSSFTKISWDTERYDSNSNYDNVTNYQYTIPVTGYYLINSSCIITAGAGTNTNFIYSVFVNGAEAARGSFASSVVASSGLSLSVFLTGFLTAGDTVDVRCYYENAVNAPIITGSGVNAFAAHLLSTD